MTRFGEILYAYQAGDSMLFSGNFGRLYQDPYFQQDQPQSNSVFNISFRSRFYPLKSTTPAWSGDRQKKRDRRRDHATTAISVFYAWILTINTFHYFHHQRHGSFVLWPIWVQTHCKFFANCYQLIKWTFIPSQFTSLKHYTMAKSTGNAKDDTQPKVKKLRQKKSVKLEKLSGEDQTRVLDKAVMIEIKKMAV